MTGKVHVAIGTSSLLAFCIVYPKGFEFAGAHVLPYVGLVTAAFGSYLPDIDMQRTHMGAKHKVTSKVVSKVGGGHRGITHTLLVPAIMAVLMFLVGTYFAKPDFLPALNSTLIPFLRISLKHGISSILMSLVFGAEFGYCMHIFADAFNGKGVPLLWPISKSKVSFADFPSEGFGAWAFAVILAGIEFAIVAHLGGLF